MPKNGVGGADEHRSGRRSIEVALREERNGWAHRCKLGRNALARLVYYQTCWAGGGMLEELGLPACKHLRTDCACAEGRVLGVQHRGNGGEELVDGRGEGGGIVGRGFCCGGRLPLAHWKLRGAVGSLGVLRTLRS